MNWVFAQCNDLAHFYDITHLIYTEYTHPPNMGSFQKGKEWVLLLRVFWTVHSSTLLVLQMFYTYGSIGLFEGVTVYCFKKKGVPERTPRNYYTFRNKVVTGFTLL